MNEEPNLKMFVWGHVLTNYTDSLKFWGIHEYHTGDLD